MVEISMSGSGEGPRGASPEGYSTSTPLLTSQRSCIRLAVRGWLWGGCPRKQTNAKRRRHR